MIKRRLVDIINDKSIAKLYEGWPICFLSAEEDKETSEFHLKEAVRHLQAIKSDTLDKDKVNHEDVRDATMYLSEQLWNLTRK